MKTTDTSEKGLETIIVNSLCNEAGYQSGDPKDYDREHAVDLDKLLAFISKTQPKAYDSLGLAEEGPRRLQFLHRLQGEISKRGVIDLFRKGFSHQSVNSIDLFYGAPTPGNDKAKELFESNIFSVTRQLRYSKDETQLALDMVIFINGLPFATFELKNNLTKQTVSDAVQQYQQDRDSKELLFHFGRCAVHFALDDQEIKMCTHLTDKSSWFLPFNKGFNDGAGNPPNPDGLKTDYLWKEILTREGLTNIIENYAQIVEEEDKKTGKKKRKQIFPRYHQLGVVQKLLADVREYGAGKRYLIQHSAGSGKSNSIAWLAHQFVDLRKDDDVIFDSVIIVTDRRILDKQIKDTIKQFAQVSSTVGHAERSGDLRKFISQGKRIIITTIQKFPFILKEIGDDHRGRNFAIIIDEAHSSQGGRVSAQMHIALSEHGEEADETYEDIINRIMESRKMLSNASYFAFTATPKNKTLEIFGDPYPEGDKIKHCAFHSYTMKQAIQEGFILDVLANYTPVDSYYHLMKAIPDDPKFDAKRAKKKIMSYIDSHEHAIKLKAEIMVDHFLEQVITKRKIDGQARAMVVTGSIHNAMQYYDTIVGYLREIKNPYHAIVAFSGEHDYGGHKVTEASLNGFPSSKIKENFAAEEIEGIGQKHPYRFLVVAEKFQTGYDEPLLHTMYVDKILSGIKAVQTLSRLNRARPGKRDTFVLDFVNNTETIKDAFSDYYRTTILSGETDPNKLHDLKSDLDGYQVYLSEQVGGFVELYLGDADRERLDPILDACVAVYMNELDEDGQVAFKGKSKAFVRTYSFLSSILPYTNAEWEKLSTFLTFLIPKLPAPIEEDLSKGILEAIDMDSYRVEVREAMILSVPDDDAEIDPFSGDGEGRKSEPEFDLLSNIIKSFNELFGNINWKDKDRLNKLISEEIPVRVSADQAYQNAIKNSDKQNARIEHDEALRRVMTSLVADHTELFKLFSDNQSFRKWYSDNVFTLTYDKNVNVGESRIS